jgi:surface protein
MNFSNEDMEYFLFNCLYRYYYNPESSKEISKIYQVCKMFKNSIDEKQEYLKSLYFIPKTNKELKTAVNEWCDDKYRALVKYGNISLWLTGNITDMSDLFNDNFHFNDCIKDWDTSSVIDMGFMFYHVISFNQPLNNWDTSSVTNMGDMFSYAFKFNQPLNNWDTSSVKNMELMFDSAFSFNQCLNNWDTSSVNNMEFMYKNSNMSVIPSWYNE